MKILFLVPSSYIGGCQLSTIETIRSLKENYNTINFLILPEKGPLFNLAKQYCQEIFIAQHSKWISSPVWDFMLKIKMLRGFIFAISRIYKIINKIKPDVVITNSIAIPSGAIAARIAKAPHIWYIHELGLEDQGLIFNYGTFISTRIMSWTSGRLIVNSKNVFRKYGDFFSKSKICNVDHAVSIGAHNSNENENINENQIVLVGRITKKKNQEELLKAVSILKGKKGIVLPVKLIGRIDKDYSNYLEGLAEELGISNDVKIIDFLDNPFNFLGKSSISIVCSVNEAFGRIIIESMKLGIPVVVPDSGSGPELVIQGKTGMIYRFGKPESLAECINTLLSDKKKYNKISRSAREWAYKYYNLETHANQVYSCIEKVLS